MVVCSRCRVVRGEANYDPDDPVARALRTALAPTMPCLHDQRKWKRRDLPLTQPILGHAIGWGGEEVGVKDSWERGEKTDRQTERGEGERRRKGGKSGWNDRLG